METKRIESRCPQHKKLLGCVCFDKRCKEKHLACIQCVVNNHSTCNQHMIFTHKELSRFLKVEDSIHDHKKIKKEIKMMFNMCRESINKCLNEKEARIYKEIESISFTPQFSFSDDVRDLFDLKLGDNKKKLIISPKINRYDGLRIQGFINELKNELNDSIRRTENEIKRIHSLFPILSIRDWEYDKGIAIEELEGEKGIRLYNPSTSINISLLTAYYKIPLDTHCMFKFTVLKTDDEYKQPEFGLTNSLSFEIFGGTEWSFNGVTTTNLESDPPMYDEEREGIDTGTELTMEVWPGEKVEMDNEKGTLGLQGPLKYEKGPFFLFVRLVSSEDSIQIQRLF